jgi:hypothetical protein
MKTNAELKRILDRVKTAQKKLHNLLKDQTWVEEARKYAEGQRREVKKLFAGDVSKVKAFIERNQKELERFQKDIPGEVDKLKKYVRAQRSELEKLLKNVRRAAKTGRPAKPAGAKRKSTRKSTSSSS